MKLNNLLITNFRCFESLSIDLDEQLTVLVAKNGQGKSAVLDAIRIGLWSFVSGFDLARNPGNEAGNNISIDDVRTIKKHDSTIAQNQAVRYDEMVRQLPCKITLTANNPMSPMGYDWPHEAMTWTRFRESEAPRTKTKDLDSNGINLIAKLAQNAQDQIRSPRMYDLDLLVFGYYGTGRLWSQKRLTERKSRQDTSFYMRLFGYRDCLDPSSSYKHFADWFTWIFECYREQQINEKENDTSNNITVWENTIQVVQQAIDSILQETGWHTLEYSVSHGKALILKHDEQGTLKVEQLSDGIRGILAMVGDIAYRCIKLNPHLGLNAAKEARGVVMIDEVEMHLHPAWQQTILANLIKAFPKIQFIVTTHSPQVISTVQGHQIRILDGNQVYSAETEGTKGAESSRILKRIFCVDPRPKDDPNTILLNEYLDLVYTDKWEQAKTMRKQLDAIYQGSEPALTEADLYIENRQWELDIEENP